MDDGVGLALWEGEVVVGWHRGSGCVPFEQVMFVSAGDRGEDGGDTTRGTGERQRRCGAGMAA